MFSGEDLLIAVNSAGLFKFEHFREKKEDDKNEDGFWDERFAGNTDSKPFGSSSVGIDVEFFGFRYLYGLPEVGFIFKNKCNQFSKILACNHFCLGQYKVRHLL